LKLILLHVYEINQNLLTATLYANNLEVFKFYMKDKSFTLDLMKKELTTNIEDIKEHHKKRKKDIS